jgi:hypothetical protein
VKELEDDIYEIDYNSSQKMDHNSYQEQITLDEEFRMAI